MDRLLVGLKLKDMRVKLISSIDDEEEGYGERYRRLTEMALNMEETRNGISQMQHPMQENQQVREQQVEVYVPRKSLAVVLGKGRMSNEEWMSMQECYSCQEREHFNRDCPNRGINIKNSNEEMNKNRIESPRINSIRVDAYRGRGEDGLVNKESKQDFQQSAVRRW
jgi:hypothetical protein